MNAKIHKLLNFNELKLLLNKESVKPASIMSGHCGLVLRRGHEVFLTHYSGYKNLYDEIPGDVDFIFFSAFTTCACVAYALNYFRSGGIAPAIGGPHARSYPEDSSKYFDDVLGFTGRNLVSEVVRERILQGSNECGIYVTSGRHPDNLRFLRFKFQRPIAGCMTPTLVFGLTIS